MAAMMLVRAIRTLVRTTAMKAMRKPPAIPFTRLTGLTAKTIRAAASAPGFTASILDYVLEDEPLLRVFAAEAEIAPGELLRARVGLESRGDAAPQEERKPAAPLGASNLARRFGVE